MKRRFGTGLDRSRAVNRDQRNVSQIAAEKRRRTETYMDEPESTRHHGPVVGPPERRAGPWRFAGSCSPVRARHANASAPKELSADRPARDRTTVAMRFFSDEVVGAVYAWDGGGREWDSVTLRDTRGNTLQIGRQTLVEALAFLDEAEKGHHARPWFNETEDEEV